VQTFATSVPVKSLETIHPELRNNQELYESIRLLNASGVEMQRSMRRFLIKRPIELESVFSVRLARCTYQPILSELISYFTSRLFSESLVVNGISGDSLPTNESDFYDSFLDNCDRAGSSLEEFWSKVTEDILLYGKAAVLVDLPRLETIPSTLLEQQALGGLNPYLVHINIQSLINWGTDQNGLLTWCLLKSETEEQAFLQKPVTVTTWSYYDSSEFAIYETRQEQGAAPSANASLKATGRHAMADQNEVPLHIVSADEKLWIASRCYLMLLDHLRVSNEYSWSLVQGNLAIPVLIGGDNGAQIDQRQVVSESAGLCLSHGASVSYLEPTGNCYIASQSRLSSLVEEIHRSAHLVQLGRQGSDSPATLSGYAKNLDAQPSADALNALGSTVKRALQDILEDISEIRSDTAASPSVAGFDFDGSISTDIEEAIELEKVGIPSDTFRKSIWKGIVSKKYRNLDSDSLAVMLDEIESSPVTKIIVDDAAANMTITERTSPQPET
jgi:hypothetical protein